MREITGRFGVVVGLTALTGMLLAAAIAAPAQTFTTLYSFPSSPNGAYPFATLVQGSDGKLYGTTIEGGVYNGGTVFNITPTGVLTTLYSFTLGNYPNGALVRANDESFYGTTYWGGANGVGTIFRIKTSGALTTLHSFDGTDGAYPTGLIQGADGNLYGTTYQGGVSDNGTVFKATPSGTLTTLYSFCSESGCPDGRYPDGALAQASNGTFYGTASQGANNSCAGGGCGTVFKITSAGALTTLHSFNGNDGTDPNGALIEALDGNFYGVTNGGLGNATVFKITPGGTLTTLHIFAGSDGTNPYGGLVQATDGNFYGTTDRGGANDEGTVFKVTPSGRLTTLYSFDVATGLNIYSGLVQDTNGNLYGTTGGGGAYMAGTVFAMNLGLGPFVESSVTSAKVGASIQILGTNLSGASSVTFNGTAASFKVVSGSVISTTVPAGATTGPVQVVTPSGTLTSNVNFRVEP